MMTRRYPLDLHLLREAATDRPYLAIVAALVMLRISETTSLTLLTLSGRHPMLQKAASSRNTQLPSSVLSVLNDSQERTTYALISEHIRMRGHFFAQSTVKHSPANTTISVTKVCTPARRSLYVAPLLRAAQARNVAADSPVQMP
jgi:hypothetical protein